MSETRNEIVERVRNAVLFSDGRIRLENVLTAYARVQAPRASTLKNDDGSTPQPKFSSTLLLPKRTHIEAKDLVKRQILRVLQEKNGGAQIAMANWCLQNGDHAAQPWKKGFFTINAANNADRPPALRYMDQRGAMPREGSDAKFYDGAIVDAVISLWWLAGDPKKRIAKRVQSNLLALRLLDDTAPRLATGGGGLTEEEVDDSFDWGEEQATGLHNPDEV